MLTLSAWLTLLFVGLPVLLYVLSDYLTRRFTSIHDLKLLSHQREDRNKGHTAVVLGGGLAGILSARVLFNHYRHVIIVEHDDFETDDRVRPAVPQGAHAHLVLAIANLTLRAMFPSIQDELVRRGAKVSDLGKAMQWFYWGSWRTRVHMDLPFWCCTRPFLDSLVRDLFLHFYGDKVVFLTRRQIIEPVLTTDLSKLGMHTPDTPFTNSNIKATGWYTDAGKAVPFDEFRICGVHIKKRPARKPDTVAAVVNNDNDDANAPDAVIDTENNDNDHETDAQRFTKTNRVVTNIAHTQPVKQIEVNTALHTTIRPREKDYDEEYIFGDIVVDCTGGASVLSKWCERLWKIDIPTSTIKANSMYVSHLFHEPENFDQDFICLPIYPLPGYSSYFGYLMRVENKLWQVTAMGTAGNPVPQDNLIEFIHHLRRLDHPLLHSLVSQAQPVANEALHTYHPKMYARRHWDRAANLPDGIICVGNSACIFDPMYGQGMSGVCIAALALNATLQDTRYATADGLTSYRLSQDYFQTLRDRLMFPWTLCVVEDSRWDGVELNNEAQQIRDSLFGRALKYWIRQGMVLAEYSPLAQHTAMGIMNMVCSFTSLLNPPLVYQVLQNVTSELLGTANTPEMRWKKNVLPAREQREQWEIAPTLTQEQQQAGLIYDCIKK